MKKLITACLLLISTAAVVSCTDDDDTTETTPSIVGTWKNDLEDNDMDWYWHFQPDGTWVEIVVYGTSGKANVMKRAYFFENDKLYLNLREASYKFSNNKLAVERIDEDGYPYPTETFSRVSDDMIAPYLERKSGTVLNDPFFVGNILRNMKKDVSLRCWNKNTDSHAKTVSTKKWNRHISRDVERYQQAGYI